MRTWVMGLLRKKGIEAGQLPSPCSMVSPQGSISPTYVPSQVLSSHVRPSGYATPTDGACFSGLTAAAAKLIQEGKCSGPDFGGKVVNPCDGAPVPASRICLLRGHACTVRTCCALWNMQCAQASPGPCSKKEQEKELN